MLARDWYEGFRGPHGICGQLAECAVRIELVSSGGRERSGNGVSVRSSDVSDPTQSAALSGMLRAEVLSKRYDELAALIARAGVIARSVHHGQVLDYYYLVDDGARVTWTLLADEYGQTARTLMRWRDEACDEIDDRGLLWR